MNNILKESKEIDNKKAAAELLVWLIENVENYIDSDRKLFNIYLVTSDESMPELKKLRDLFMSIPDDVDKESGMTASEVEQLINECVEYRNILNDKVEDISMEANKMDDYLSRLFEKMSFYYEKIVPDPNSYKKALEIDSELKELIKKSLACDNEEEKALLQESISKKIDEGKKMLVYERLNGVVKIVSFAYEAFDVIIKKSNVGQSLSDKDSEDNSYVMPEGFCCELEILFQSKKRQTSLF